MSVSSSGVSSQAREEFKATIAAQFTSRWPTAQVDQNGPIGVIIAAMAEVAYLTNNALVDSYNQLFLATATGTYLDSIALQNGIERIQEKYATVTLQFKGQEGYLIASGTLVRSPSAGVSFATLSSVQITDGEATVIAQATTGGTAGNLPANSITALVNALPGVSSVTNPSASIGGGGAETDDELRERVSKNIAAYGSFPILTNQLYKLDGVSSVDILENLSNLTSAEGLPPKSIAILINGGDSQAIGQCLYEFLPVGTQTHGEESVQVITPFGRTLTYYFVRPQIKLINLTITSAIEVSSDFKSELQTIWTDYLLTLSGGKTITEDELMIAIPNSFITRYLTYFNNINFNLTIQMAIDENEPGSSVTLAYNQIPNLGEITWI